MKALKIVPEISYFDTFKEFAENFNLGKGDILVTNKWLFEPIVQPCVPDIQVVYQEKYGVGEPTDEMMDASHRFWRRHYNGLLQGFVL